MHCSITYNKFLLLTTLVVIFGSGSFAYDYQSEDYCILCKTKRDMHEVHPWLEMGADFRFRTLHQDARKLDRKESGHDRLRQRYRVRTWARIKRSENLSYNIALVTEPRYYWRPDLERQFIRHEALFDRMNFELKNAFDMPLTLKAGRQNIKLGDGWLICEGTPGDGSRSYFFDAVRLTYALEEPESSFDLIVIDNHANSSEWIRPFNDRDVALAEQDERGLILYLSTMSHKGAQIDGYFIYKNDRNRAIGGNEGNIYTLGTLIKDDIDNNWKYSIQLAPQFGHKNGKDINAFASNARLSYHFNDIQKNTIYFDYEYLSGDDDPDKNFDRLWGRDPSWSSLYKGGIDALDGREADNSNMHRLTAGWGYEPVENVNFTAAYNLLFADDNTSAGGTNGLSKSGNFRGQLITVMLKQKISHHLQHRINAEIMFPGDFYNKDRNDIATYLRYELVFTW